MNENVISDGYGQTRVPGNDGLIKVWIKVRKDREIPDFDAISEVRIEQEGLEDKYADLLSAVLTDQMGMFINDALKLEERDLLSIAGEDFRVPEISPIPSLRAFKKAVYDYFEKSGQTDRLRKATERIVCRCRNVSDTEIKAAVKRGKNTFEMIKNFTGAGSGCGTCENKVIELLSER